MTRSNNKSRVIEGVRDITLKKIHDDILRDDPNNTTTTKKMRVWLRMNMRDIHVHFASWLFTQNEYDIVRSQFDTKFREKLSRAEKRAQSSKVKTKNVVDVDTSTHENVDDDA